MLLWLHWVTLEKKISRIEGCCTAGAVLYKTRKKEKLKAKRKSVEGEQENKKSTGALVAAGVGDLSIIWDER